MLILTGASGSGKTTLAKHVLDQVSCCEVLFFDSIGVPPLEEMEREYGSGEQWQRAMTLGWIERIKPLLSADFPILFEGQMRIAFIQEALAASAISDAEIILVDCDDATRSARLCLDRSQPELANPDMMNWARYLREEAQATGSAVLDTGVNSLAACAKYLMDRLGLPHPA